MNMQLPDVSRHFGAPYGRLGNVTDTDFAVLFQMVKLAWVDGDYDEGGAYWGRGKDRSEAIYWAKGDGEEEVQEVFIRAKSQADAQAQLLDQFPNAQVQYLGDANGLSEFEEAYVEAALWSSTVETEDREHPHYGESFADAGFTVADFGDGELAAIREDCARFLVAAGAMLQGWTDAQAGHDLWLTRNGHGAGFWDRGKRYGQELTNLVGHGAAFPPLDLYVGDDGKVYGFARPLDAAVAAARSCC